MQVIRSIRAHRYRCRCFCCALAITVANWKHGVMFRTSLRAALEDVYGRANDGVLLDPMITRYVRRVRS